MAVKVEPYVSDPHHVRVVFGEYDEEIHGYFDLQLRGDGSVTFISGDDSIIVNLGKEGTDLLRERFGWDANPADYKTNADAYNEGYRRGQASTDVDRNYYYDMGLREGKVQGRAAAVDKIGKRLFGD